MSNQGGTLWYQCELGCLYTFFFLAAAFLIGWQRYWLGVVSLVLGTSFFALWVLFELPWLLRRARHRSHTENETPSGPSSDRSR